MRKSAGATFALALLCIGFAAQAEERAEQIPTRNGVTQAFLYESPERPRATLILLPGGSGAIKLDLRTGRMGDLNENFPVRVRHKFAEQGFAVATLDTPSNRADGMGYAFRITPEHASDLAAVASWLKTQNGAPIWLVGTSNGTVSAASAAALLGTAIDGVVLTSTIVSGPANAVPRGVLSLDLDKINVPVLVLAHSDDACRISAPTLAGEIVASLKSSPRAAQKTIAGGLAPKSGPCDALSPHGFYGVEEIAVSAVADFILKN